MANPLSETVRIGTVGELLSQVRLLELGVQAAPPIKDSGNDLVAILGRQVRFVQIKTKLRGRTYSRDLPDIYDLLFCVDLKFNERENGFLFDASTITVYNNQGEKLGLLTLELVNQIWS